MYDPARDSWSASSENSADEKESKILKQLPSDESGETEDETPVRIENTSENRGDEDISTEPESGKDNVIDASVNGQPNDNTDDKTTNTTNAVIDSAETTDETKRKDERNESKANNNNITAPAPAATTPSSPTSPPRKLKKPTRRASVSERDKKAQELRSKINRREHNDIDSTSPDHDSKRRAVEGIRKHYNERPNTSVQERQQSPILKLRSFNNLVKSMLIKKFSRYNEVVLDIGCGKGGDLQKWLKQRIAGLIGIDIADVSIEQAKERYAHLRNKTFWADFCVGDAFDRTVEDIVHPDAFPVDLVSSQFTLQYSFENEQRARMMLSNVGRSLRRGGIFMGTIPDSTVLLNHISHLPRSDDGSFTSREWGNSIYKIRFENDPPKSKEDLTDIYGYKYDFFLEDAVTNVPEYIVPFDAFCTLALEYGLRLVFRKNFLDFFDDEFNISRERTNFLCRKLKVFKEDGVPGIEGEQREAAGIYTVFAFEKE